MDSHTALLIIDYTNDFVADKGALTCGAPGQKLEPAIINLADQFVQNGDWVILPTDVHKPNDPYHPETKLFPLTMLEIPGEENFTASWLTGTRITKKTIKFTCTTRRVIVRLPEPIWISD